MIAVLLFVAAVLCYISFRFKRRRLYELAALIPEAPMPIPFIGALQYTISFEDPSFNMMNLIKLFSTFAVKQGGLIKLWAGPILFVGITDPTDLEFVLRKCLEKSNVLWLLQTVIGNAGIFAPVSIWVRRRKLTVPAFSPRIINSYIDVLIEKSENLAQSFSVENLVGTGTFKAWSHVSSYTLDTIFETALGITDNGSNPERKKFLEESTKLLALITHRGLRVWLWPDFIYKWTKDYSQFIKSRKFTYEFTDKIIQRKRKELENVEIEDAHLQNGVSKTVRCFLDNLILLSRAEQITDTELREEVLTFLFGGTDTSSVSICNTLKLLAKYPKVQEKLYDELMEVLGDPKRTITKDDLPQLKYLERVLKESLRLFPPAPITLRKVHEETELPSGKILPTGSHIFIGVWAASRDPKFWGRDADCFDPDRFLPERQVGLFIPFSCGPRNCIGTQFAYMSIKLALTAILRRYRITGEEESGPVPHMDCSFNIMMKARDDYEIGLEMR
ncbi:unnamed protein product [Leptosia nina]|uniref:Cytochrome P450 n=1 Tax=Leptosia nina TaxID=320188 RepID=A0AAV1JNJ4_9NEOP